MWFEEGSIALKVLYFTLRMEKEKSLLPPNFYLENFKLTEKLQE